MGLLHVGRDRKMPKKKHNPFLYWIQPALEQGLLTKKQLRKLTDALAKETGLTVDVFPLVQWVNLVNLPPDLTAEIYRAQ